MVEITNKKKSRLGSALLLAVILLFVVLSLVMTLTYVTVMEQKMSLKSKSSVGAFFNAESGVEWALNTIASGSGNIDSVTAFSSQWKTDGYVACPPDFGEETCKVYLIDDQGRVITVGTTDVSAITAVRSVGSKGEETERAIEASVAAASGAGMPYDVECSTVSISGMFGTNDTFCCMMTTKDGSAQCKSTDSLTYPLPNWETLTNPFSGLVGTGNDGQYVMSCQNYTSTFMTYTYSNSYCCRVDTTTGATDICKTLDPQLSWSSSTKPFTALSSSVIGTYKVGIQNHNKYFLACRTNTSTGKTESCKSASASASPSWSTYSDKPFP